MPNPAPRPRVAGSRGARTGRYPVRGAAPRTKDEGRSVLGFVENIGEDLAEAIVGLPAGVVETARNPIKTAKAIGRSYQETYGHGVKHFLSDFYENPVGPILDALTIASLGTTAAATGGARAAGALGKAGAAARLAQLGKPAEITLRSPRLARQGEGPAAVKQTSKRPLRKAQQLATDRFMRLFNDDLPIIGEFARYGREMDRIPRQDATRLKAGMTDYLKAMAKLKGAERPALAMLMRGVSPEDYRRFLQAQPNQDLPGVVLKALEDPKVSALWRAPSDRMMAAYERHAELADLDAQIKIGQGRLTAETAEARPSQWRARIGEALGDLEEPPVPPVYIPDHGVKSRVANADFARMGGGASVPKAVGGVNHGVLMRTGQIALDPDLLGPEFLRDVKYGMLDDIHDGLLDAGARIPRGAPLPAGWVAIRRKVRGGEVVDEGPGRPEQLGYLEKNRGEHDRAIADLFDEDDELRVVVDRDLITRNPDEAHVDEDGSIVVIPERLAKQVAGEFHRLNRPLRLLLEKPTTVWRALVLGARPGFLVNNMVGNHLLYALRFSGPAGQRAYLNMLAETSGLGAVRKLLMSKDTPPGISKQFLREFFPEQSEAGTAIATQVPGGRLGKWSKRASLGLQAVDRNIEAGIRRAAVEAGLRRTPRVRAILKEMPKETRSFEAAARKALDEDENLARRVSDEVNGALGNYLNLSAFERNAVRAVLPFYAWTRAISIIAAKMPLETPGRAALLANLGHLGSDMTVEALGELPSYLRGVIMLGDGEGGTERILTTQGLNPLGTVAQAGRAAYALAAREPGEFGTAASDLGPNPFLKALLEQISGVRLFGGYPTTGDSGNAVDLPAVGLPGSILADVLEQLPQLQLARGPSNLYPERDVLSQIYAYFGWPMKDLNVSEANRRAKQERER